MSTATPNQVQQLHDSQGYPVNPADNPANAPFGAAPTFAQAPATAPQVVAAPAQSDPYYGAYYPQQLPYKPAPATTNILAILSLVFSIAIMGIVGVILGHLARKQIRETGENGDGLALAGMIIGYVRIGFTLLIIGFYIVLIVILLINGEVS